VAQNNYTDIDHHIVRAVRYYARKLKANACFETEEICALEQELMLFVFVKMKQFDVQRSQIGTFVSKILQNHTANLIREKYTQKSCDCNIVHDFDWQNFKAETCAENMINAADINVFVGRHLPRYLQETFEILKYNYIK
jgi:hypothetical protein